MLSVLCVVRVFQDVQKKGAQDGSEECSVFYVWSGYFKMCQNKGRRIEAMNVRFSMCGQGISRCGKIKGRRMGARDVQCSMCGQGISRRAKIKGARWEPGMFSFLCVVSLFQDVPK